MWIPLKRINGGTDRFETNLKILRAFKYDLKNDKLYIANATTDAFVASTLASKSASPLILVDTDKSPATQNALCYIKSELCKYTDLNVICGTWTYVNILFQIPLLTK